MALTRNLWIKDTFFSSGSIVIIACELRTLFSVTMALTRNLWIKDTFFSGGDFEDTHIPRPETDSQSVCSHKYKSPWTIHIHLSQVSLCYCADNRFICVDICVSNSVILVTEFRAYHWNEAGCTREGNIAQMGGVYLHALDLWLNYMNP